MFSEHRDVKQERSGQRRWFESDEIDLVVWLDDAGSTIGFQLCFALPDGERALTWRRDSGFAHGRIDSGDHSPLRNETPILVSGGAVPWAQVETLFHRHSATLEPTLRSLINDRLVRRA